jgi:acetolactate synthase I/II/III large subunit
VPVVCLTGQVPTHLIGNDAFQEADTTGITRPVTKHNYLVKSISDLSRVIHEAFHVSRSGRPGPVVVDLPKDVQQAKHEYANHASQRHRSYNPQVKPDRASVERAVELMAKAERPLFYIGGGVVNSGPAASQLLTEFIRLTGFPCTQTLMGLGAFPASDPLSLGMVGMHGMYESNHAMHDCDLMINIGARFDDRVTGKLAAFSPGSKKIHVDIDPSSINKNVHVDLAIVGDVGHVVEDMLRVWKARQAKPNGKAIAAWWEQINKWRARECLRYRPSNQVIKPQYALQRLYDAIKHRDYYITTEVGQHQMWAAQFIKFEKPNHWLTSGGLGTMGYGLPAAIGVQIAHPEALVIDVAGEASIMMNIQEMSTAAQYRLPVKLFIMNNRWMGMVRQWQELLHGGRYSESYSDALPDFVKLADAFGWTGLRATKPAEMDDVIKKMIETPGPVIVDVAVDEKENCFPMIPSGSAHNEMLLGPDDQKASPVSEEGMVLV